MVRQRRPRRRASSYVWERAAAQGSAVTRLRQALASSGLAPPKRFGQNSLVREDLAEGIVEHFRLREDIAGGSGRRRTGRGTNSVAIR